MRGKEIKEIMAGRAAQWLKARVWASDLLCNLG